jgi:hypothetical protein
MLTSLTTTEEATPVTGTYGVTPVDLLTSEDTVPLAAPGTGELDTALLTGTDTTGAGDDCAAGLVETVAGLILKVPGFTCEGMTTPPVAAGADGDAPTGQ